MESKKDLHLPALLAHYFTHGNWRRTIMPFMRLAGMFHNRWPERRSVTGFGRTGDDSRSESGLNGSTLVVGRLKPAASRRSNWPRFRAVRRGASFLAGALVLFLVYGSARAQTEPALAQRVHRVQAARNGVRHGGARNAVPRACDPRRLRRDLPRL